MTSACPNSILTSFIYFFLGDVFATKTGISMFSRFVCWAFFQRNCFLGALFFCVNIYIYIYIPLKIVFKNISLRLSQHFWGWQGMAQNSLVEVVGCLKSLSNAQFEPVIWKVLGINGSLMIMLLMINYKWYMIPTQFPCLYIHNMQSISYSSTCSVLAWHLYNFFQWLGSTPSLGKFLFCYTELLARFLVGKWDPKR